MATVIKSARRVASHQRKRRDRGRERLSREDGQPPAMDRVFRDGLRDVPGDSGYPDRRQFAGTDSGRAIGDPGRNHLGADRLSGGGSGDHPVVGLAGTGFVHALPVRPVLRRLYLDEPVVRVRLESAVHGGVPRLPGFFRRGDDPDRCLR